MFHGTLVALITPYTSSDEVDLTAYARLIEWQIDSGIEGIVIAGSTGEGWALTSEEKFSLLDCALDVTKGRVPVIFSSGTASTSASLILTQAAKERGADGCLVTFPYYNKPMEEGCVRHFELLASVGIPLIPYYHPGRTGLTLSMEGIARIAQIKGVVALKDCSGDPQFIPELLKRVPIDILSGDDQAALEAMNQGAKGVISVIANAFPKEWKKEEFRELIEALNGETNPQPIKFVMSLLGKCRPDLRLPLMLPAEKTQQRLSQLLDQILSIQPIPY